jgi:hypothetical protein
MTGGEGDEFGGLLLRAYSRGRLSYVGQTDIGFSGEKLSKILSRLVPMVRPESPFASTHHTIWQDLWSQTFASLDKTGFKAASAASPNRACQRSSGRSGGVAAGAVVDNEVYLDLVSYLLAQDLNGILDHLRTKCLASEEAIKPSQQRIPRRPPHFPDPRRLTSGTYRRTLRERSGESRVSRTSHPSG